MSIRHATSDDLGQLLPLFRGYTDFYESDPSDDGLERLIADVIERPNDQAFLLVATDNDDDDVVGFANCNWKWSSLRGARIVFLDDIFVRPDSRGEGLADALLATIADIAREGGAPAVEWLTGTDNRRAHAVYDRVGGKAEALLEYELEV